MGKIHDRLKRRNEARHCIRQPAPAVMADTTPTLTRIQNIIDAVKQARGFSLMNRHEEMQRLANEAKNLGLKGRFNMLCNRTQCLAEGATWYNRGSYAFYCKECAHDLNHANRYDSFCKDEPLCREITDVDEAARLPVTP